MAEPGESQARFFKCPTTVHHNRFALARLRESIFVGPHDRVTDLSPDVDASLALTPPRSTAARTGGCTPPQPTVTEAVDRPADFAFPG
jgi:hypothetical protein